MNSRSFFLGGNTSKGFYNLFDSLVPGVANRIFCLKGGPGVGKSTLMKKVGKKMEDWGYEVEYFYCSSDSQSLDGVTVKELKVALVDGTAPHIVDPKYPGVVDEIINLGQLIDMDELGKDKDNIIKVSQSISRNFNTAYSSLDTAANFYQENASYVKGAIDKRGWNIEADQLMKKILSAENENRVNQGTRDMFGRSYTPQGVVNKFEEILSIVNEIYVVEGEIGTGKSALVKKVLCRAEENGYYCEAYHSPLVPDKLEAVIINELKVAVVSKDAVKDLDLEAWLVKTVNLDQYIDLKQIKKYQVEIEYCQEQMNRQIKRALSYIKQAKKEHDDLERFYVPRIDFEGTEIILDDILARILAYVEQ